MDSQLIEAWAAMLSSLAWPVAILLIAVLFRRRLSRLIEALISRVYSGAEIKTLWLTIGKSVGPLKEPKPEDLVTGDHLALVHSSWRVPERDKEFGGAEMYRIHVILYGADSVLDRVQYVIYHLDPAYPQPVQSSTVRDRNFELKELANGFSVIRAEAKIKDQEELVQLSRFINLSEEGPRLDVYMRLKDAKNKGIQKYGGS